MIEMKTRGSPVGLQGLVEVFRMHRIQTTRHSNLLQRFTPVVINRFGRDYRMGQGLKLIGSVNKNVIGDSRRWFRVNKDVNNDDTGKTPISPPPPNPWFNFPGWARWVIGSVLSILLPFCHQKLRKLKRIEEEAEMAVEGAEIVAEVVEKVATATEKMSEDLAEKLPEDSNLKKTAAVVEHISSAAAHDAHLAKDVLHKVDELQQDLGDLEEMVKPAADNNNIDKASEVKATQRNKLI